MAMADPQFDPPRSLPTYVVRKPLLHFLRRQADDAHATFGRYRVLDVGCGRRFYEPLFAPHASSYVGVDPVDNPKADLRGAVEDPVSAECGVGVVGLPAKELEKWLPHHVRRL